ncbi:MAG TPA: DUF4493 domain-containing protein [Candidatus Alistipes faecavium]|nr:DUF4493 domain-containing protein [Candidatus Alistipes faecavium]
MKRQTLYTAAALALTAGVLAGCSKNDIDTGSQTGTGTVALHVSATRAGDDSAASSAYDPLAFQSIRIYNASDELLRHYTATSLPERLELLAGNYSVGVEVGEQVPASFEKKYYVGKQSFTVTAGQTAGVEVKCTRQNVMAKVAFDASIAEKFGTAVKVWVAAAAPEQSAELGKGSLDELTFTEAANGYFMLPEDVTTLVYKFEGTHSDPTVGNNGLITREGSLAGVSAGANCSMTFRYSEDAPGYIECFTIQVDDTTEDFTDDIVWTDISITGDGFNVEEQQDYIPGKSAAVTYQISNLTPIRDVMLYAGDETYDLLDNSYPGISVDKTNDREMKVSLSDDFFTALGGGAQSLRLRVRDTSNGELSRTTPFRVQGLLPVGASDCDLWFNRVTLKALILDPEASDVTFKLGEKSAAGVAGEEGVYTATFEPEWMQTTNSENSSYPSYYLPEAGTGVFAGEEYTCELTAGSFSSSISFSTPAGDAIPGGDMEGSLSCFTTDNKTTTTWGSGNNTMKKNLCNAGSFTGMGGSQCAKLSASETAGVLASGNLFTGIFSMDGLTTGMVGFGQKYNYTARPKSLKFKYHATIGAVDINKYGTIQTGEQDISTIYVAIVDWSARHVVTSGMSAPTGTWDPAAQTTLEGSGAIIAYGIMDITSTTSGDAMVEGEIPLRYFSTDTAAPAGNYTLVISCATSKYGDYMNGCSTNVLYVDDFTWGY